MKECNDNFDGERQGLAIRSDSLVGGQLSYIAKFVAALVDLWSEENKAGYICLCVAENKLGNELFRRRLELVEHYPSSVLNYDSTFGTEQFRKAIAKMVHRTFLHGSIEFDENDLVVSAGCGAIINNTYYILCDAGSGVLIPAPYYPAFDADLRVKCDLIPCPFHLEVSRDIRLQLELAVEQATVPIRSLLLTNPNNPLGTIYSKDVVREMIVWAVENRIHFVSDEIYALSVHGDAQFVSAFTLAAELISSGRLVEQQVHTYVHIMYGLSKDWCASGLRVGILISKNARLHMAMSSVAPLAMLSNHTQHALTQMLSDELWVDVFLADTNRKLKDSYDAISNALIDSAISFTPAHAGMFVWLDLREFMRDKSWKAENDLFDFIYKECKVVLTPGQACHAGEPGYARMCFAAVPMQAALEAIGRMKAVLGQFKLA